MPKFPCGVCSKNVNENHHAICCDICDQWVHIRCNLLCEKDYNIINLKNNPESDQSKNDFYCITCTKNILPFNKLSDSDYYSIVQRGVVLSDEVIDNDELNFSKCKEFTKNLNTYLANYSEQNNEEDMSSPIDCKYYSLEDFTQSNYIPSKLTSILHINIHSIEKHISELKNYLMLTGFVFDVLAISESKLQTNTPPKVDISIEGYHYPLSTPTKATKGGVL